MWAAGTGDEKIYWHGKADGRRAVSLLLRIGCGRLEMTGAGAVVPGPQGVAITIRLQRGSRACMTSSDLMVAHAQADKRKRSR